MDNGTCRYQYNTAERHNNVKTQDVDFNSQAPMVDIGMHNKTYIYQYITGYHNNIIQTTDVDFLAHVIGIDINNILYVVQTPMHKDTTPLNKH